VTSISKIYLLIYFSPVICVWHLMTSALFVVNVFEVQLLRYGSAVLGPIIPTEFRHYFLRFPSVDLMKRLLIDSPRDSWQLLHLSPLFWFFFSIFLSFSEQLRMSQIPPTSTGKTRFAFFLERSGKMVTPLAPLFSLNFLEINWRGRKKDLFITHY